MTEEEKQKTVSFSLVPIAIMVKLKGDPSQGAQRPSRGGEGALQSRKCLPCKRWDNFNSILSVLKLGGQVVFSCK